MSGNGTGNTKELKALKKAIAAKCKDCSGGIIEELNGCEIMDCPLYIYRPRYKERKQKLNSP